VLVLYGSSRRAVTVSLSEDDMHSVQNSECSVRDALRYGGACCNGNVGMATLGRAAGLVKERS